MTIESLDHNDTDDEVYTAPCQYMWMRGGVMDHGPLREYAYQWVRREHNGGEPEMTRQLITWDGDGTPVVLHAVTFTRGEMTKDYWIPWTLTVNGEEVYVRVDGRA